MHRNPSQVDKASDREKRSPRRAANLIYGVADPVPVSSLIPLVAQQVIMLSVDLIFPVLIVAAASGTVEMAQTAVSMMMISMGIGTILQAWRNGPVGSGYFCAHETGTPYFPASIMAVQAGGFPLMCGMTLFAGVFQSLIGRIIHRLRILFPVEIIGLIVMLMAITFITYALPNFIGLDAQGSVSLPVSLLSVTALGVIIGMHIWGSQRIRECSIVVGIVVGYLGSYMFGLLPADKVDKFIDAPWIALPSFGHMGLAFDPALVVPFIIAAFASSIKTLGNLTTCQKVNDDEWKRLDMKSVGNGLFAEGIGTIIGGLLGTMGQTTSSGSVGLSVATGATSRQIAVGTGLCFIVLAILPKIAALFAIMPQPVIGVILMVEIAFVLPTAMQICSSRMLNARRLFVLGISLTFGLGVAMVPGFGESFPLWLQPLTKNALALGTIIGISLHLLFRIGIATHQKLVVEPETDAMDAVFVFFRNCGGLWGARSDVVSRTTSAVAQCIETLTEFQLVQGNISIDASFEEFNLNVDIEYAGVLPVLSATRPTAEEMLNDEDAFARLSGYLVKCYADKVDFSTKNGRCSLHLNFEH